MVLPLDSRSKMMSVGGTDTSFERATSRSSPPPGGGGVRHRKPLCEYFPPKKMTRDITILTSLEKYRPYVTADKSDHLIMISQFSRRTA